VASVTRDNALALRATNLEATLNTTIASINSVDFASVTRDSALSGRLSTAETTLNGNTASISTLQQSVNGLSVRYSVIGNINGVTGGFEFSGIQRDDGGPVYFFDVFAGMRVHGSLVVDGTITVNELGAGSVGTAKVIDAAVTNPKIIDNACSNHAEAAVALSAGSTASVVITVRANARVSLDATLQVYDTSSIVGPSTSIAATARAHFIYVDGAFADTAYEYDRLVQAQYAGQSGAISVYNFATLAGGSSYTGFFGPLAAGSHTFSIQNNSSGNMRAVIRATEMAK
jgi:hypothetical protein